jgi:hypothetical protein
MTHFLYLIIILSFAWISAVQALPYPDDFHHQPSLALQAAISLAHNKGDILKAAEKLANSGTLKNMTTDVAFAVLLGTPSSGANIGTLETHSFAWVLKLIESAIGIKGRSRVC